MKGAVKATNPLTPKDSPAAEFGRRGGLAQKPKRRDGERNPGGEGGARRRKWRRRGGGNGGGLCR